MSILTAIAAADEGYLIALANKGLYNRALRELESAGVTTALDGERLTASFADGTTVTMEGSVQSYKCSCPSRTVCKHLLMAVLAAKSLAESAGTATASPQSPPDFSCLEDFPAKELEKAVGKRLFKNAVLAVRMGETATIEESSTLTVTLNDSGSTVKFLPDSPPQSAGCSCKSTGWCAHKAQAIVQYITYKKGSLPGDYAPPDEESPLEFGTYTLPYIKTFVADVLDTGLARLPEGAAGRFLQLATLCHGQRLANMERLCNRISGQLDYFEQRSATFSPDYLLGDLCTLLNLCADIERRGGTKASVGVFRETYRPVPKLELHGLGAWGWHSTGGYTGVTTLFFSPEQGIVSYTSALPDNVAPPAEKLYLDAAPWKLPVKLSALSRMRLTVSNGKLSGKGQLSASEGTTARETAAADIHAAELSPLRFSDFEALLFALWKTLEQDDGSAFYAILLPRLAEDSAFDGITQEWSCILRDENDRALRLRVGYEAATALLIENLTRAEGQKRLSNPLLARVYLQDGALCAFPITYYQEDTINLSLDVPSVKTSTIYFDWGDS